MLGLNAMVCPKSEQMALAPGAGAPLRVDTGTSTAGVRTPPMTLPCASRASVGGVVLEKLKRGGRGGGVPWSTHLLKAAKAAWTTMCCGPLFTGVRAPEDGRGGADEVGVGVRRARHLPGADPVGVGLLRRRRSPRRMRSVWVSNMKTGTPQVGADPQVRRALGAEVMDDPLRGAPLPPRLWMKMPSKVLVSGWMASANVVR